MVASTAILPVVAALPEEPDPASGRVPRTTVAFVFLIRSLGAESSAASVRLALCALVHGPGLRRSPRPCADPRRLIWRGKGQCNGSAQSIGVDVAWPLIGRSLAAVVASTSLAADISGQGLPPPVTRVSMDDAVRLTIERNQTLRGQRLTIDAAIADQTTAALKPNPGLSFGADGFTPFSPRQVTWDFLGNKVSYSTALSYTFERGGKRAKRTTVAEDTTDVTRKNVIDFERQLRFQAEQAFVGALLAKSALDLAQQDLKSFSEVVEINRQRVAAGDLAQGDFYKISLQKLQFEQDVSAAQVNLIQAKASLRQLMGFESIADDFEIDGDSAFVPHDAEPRGSQAPGAREPPRRPGGAAPACTLARDTVSLELGNRAQDSTATVSYAHRARTTRSASASPSICPFTIATRATSRTARSRSGRRSRPRPRPGSPRSPTS